MRRQCPVSLEQLFTSSSLDRSASILGIVRLTHRSVNIPRDFMPYDTYGQGGQSQQQSPGVQQFSAPGQNSASHPNRRGSFQSNFNMASMVGALPDYQSHPGSQTSHPESQRYPGAVSGQSLYNPQQYPGQSAFNPNNPQTHPSQYADSYQEAAALAQAYGQMQAAQRSYSGGPSPIQSSYPNASYFPNAQQQYLYYPGQMSQFGQMAPPSPFGQALGHYGTDMGTRTYHSGYPPGNTHANQYLRPGMPGRSNLARRIYMRLIR